MVEPPELPKDITSSGQMDSGEQKESRESADLKVDLKGVVRSETESQVIVKGVAGKAKAPIPQEVEQLQRDEDDPSPVHVWKGPSTDGAFSYHSKGRCARKQNAQNPAESNVVTQFHTEDRWETKTESSASFHSKGRRSAAPVVDERAEEVVPPPEGQVDKAAQGAQQVVVVALPLAVHTGQPPPEPSVDILGYLQLIESAGHFQAPFRGGSLLHQSGGEGQMGVLPGKAVKGPIRPCQADGGVGVIVPGGQVDEPGKAGPGPGEKNIYRSLRHGASLLCLF